MTPPPGHLGRMELTLIQRAGDDRISNMPKHRESASRVRPLFDQYLLLTGSAQADNPADMAPYVDLVADILHLAASRGVDHEHLLKTATMHFEAEAITPDDVDPMIVATSQWIRLRDDLDRS